MARLNLNNSSFSLHLQERSWSRVRLGPGEISNRIAIGKQLIDIRPRYTKTAWTEYLKNQRGLKPERAQGYMRVARRFGSPHELTVRVTTLGIPYNVLEALSSEMVPDDLVRQFLDAADREGFVASTENCQKLINELLLPSSPSQQVLLDEDVKEDVAVVEEPLSQQEVLIRQIEESIYNQSQLLDSLRQLVVPLS